MTSKIIVSFPERPDVYRKTTTISWSQISHFVYKAISEKFPNVSFVNFDQDIEFNSDDILVTCVPNSNLLKWKRSILVDNDNFLVDKWKDGKWTQHGCSFPTDHTFKYNKYVEGCLSAFMKTNDVALSRWNNDDPLVLEKKQWFTSVLGSVHPIPHPIDKKWFSSLYKLSKKIEKPTMLVYHQGWRKNAKELIEILTSLQQKNTSITWNWFDHVDAFNPQVVEQIITHYSFLGHVSVCEGFPYLANEFMVRGMTLFAHEDWWDGQGNKDLTWSYDPARLQDNTDKLLRLFSLSTKELEVLREEQWSKHMTRKDNNWDTFTTALCEEIQKHIK